MVGVMAMAGWLFVMLSICTPWAVITLHSTIIIFS